MIDTQCLQHVFLEYDKECARNAEERSLECWNSIPRTWHLPNSYLSCAAVGSRSLPHNSKPNSLDTQCSDCVSGLPTGRRCLSEVLASSKVVYRFKVVPLSRPPRPRQPIPMVPSCLIHLPLPNSLHVFMGRDSLGGYAVPVASLIRKSEIDEYTQSPSGIKELGPKRQREPGSLDSLIRRSQRMELS